MTPADTARVLALVQAFDNRNVDELVVAAWHSVLGDLGFDDSCTAVREHYTRSSDWLMPDQIRAHVKRIRADRLARTPDPVPAVDPDNPRAFVDAVRQTRRAIADGQQPPAERLRIEGARGLPPGFVDTFRDVRDQRRPKQIEGSAAATDAEQLAEQQARAEIAALHQPNSDVEEVPS